MRPSHAGAGDRAEDRDSHRTASAHPRRVTPCGVALAIPEGRPQIRVGRRAPPAARGTRPSQRGPTRRVVDVSVAATRGGMRRARRRRLVGSPARCASTLSRSSPCREKPHEGRRVLEGTPRRVACVPAPFPLPLPATDATLPGEPSMRQRRTSVRFSGTVPPRRSSPFASRTTKEPRSWTAGLTARTARVCRHRCQPERDSCLPEAWCRANAARRNVTPARLGS